MAFGADELCVLRRALAAALHPAPLPREDVQDCLRLAESVDEAVREAGRMRAFLVADLARYRQALPGSVSGYLELLQDALATGYPPGPDDLAALRALRGNPAAAALFDHCRLLAGRSVRARFAGVGAPRRTVPAAPAPRTRLLALPGGRAADGPAHPREPRKPAKPSEPGKPAKPAERPEPAEPRRPAEPAEPRRPAPDKPMPKPSEVFPPRRRPAPPPERLAAG
ncbi:hypothetical protein ACFXKG_10140 [Streptomyces sp. NPDC059255]|uniref:hypothetical protein n=1 Tax=Streptomyces sp. NPDC059255 TaxID=3346793 RepID=UPI00368359D6